MAPPVPVRRHQPKVNLWMSNLRLVHAIVGIRACRLQKGGRPPRIAWTIEQGDRGASMVNEGLAGLCVSCETESVP
jgi:hypothetical protein